MHDDVPPADPSPAPPDRFRPTVAHRARATVEEVLDATGSGWRALTAGCLVVGLVAGALWWMTRQAPAPVDNALPLVEPAAVTTTTAPPEPVVVHVAGAVARPGVQRLPAGARVIDAVEAAGGLLPGADSARVNLAGEVVDGTQVYVPAVGEAVPEVASPGGGQTGDTTVDLNTADRAALESLPGIGPATAAAILDHRERHGPFATVEGLLEVPGIGEKKLADLRDLVRV